MVYYEPATSPSATVTATKKSASITLSWSADTKYGSAVVKGDTVRFSGKVTDTATAVGLGGVPVDFYQGGSLVATLTTDSGGAYATSMAMPTTAGDTYNDFVFSGNANYNSAVANVTITVEARAPKLSLSLSATAAAVGATIIWDGQMTDPKVTGYVIAGKSVYFEQGTSATGPWTAAAGPSTTKSDGTYSGTYVLPATPGTYYYRSSFPGGSPGMTWEISLSGVTAVTIYATEDEAEAARMRALILTALATVAIVYIATRR